MVVTLIGLMIILFSIIGFILLIIGIKKTKGNNKVGIPFIIIGLFLMVPILIVFIQIITSAVIKNIRYGPLLKAIHENNAEKVVKIINSGYDINNWTLAKFRLPLAGKALWLALVPRPEAT